MPEELKPFCQARLRGPGRAALLSFFFASLALPAPARAELWQGGDTLSNRGVSFGGFAEVYGSTYARPASFMLFGQFAYGTSDTLTVETDLGLGMLDTSIGFFAKYRLFREDDLDSSGDHWSAALRAGIHNQVSLYGDAYLVLSRTMRGWEAYVSPYLSAPLITANSGTPVSFGLVPGVSFAFGRHSRLYTEANLNLGASYNAASLGIRETF